MKVRVPQTELAKALSTVIPAVAVRTTSPVITGFFIQVKDDELVITGTNLDITISKSVAADVEDTGSAVVNAKLMTDIVRKLPKNETVTLEKSGRGMRILTERTDFTVNGFSVSEFPEMKVDEGKMSPFSIDGKTFSNMIKKVELFASDDPSRGAICGVKTVVSEDEITMVALDGFRIAERKEKVSGGIGGSFLIAAPSMKEIMKIASGEDNMTVEVFDKNARFSTGDTTVIARLMEDNFLDYKRVIPESYHVQATVDKKDLYDALDRVSLLAAEGKNNLAKFSLSGDALRISSHSEEGSVDERVSADANAGIDIGFNTKYFMDILRSIDDEYISLNMNDNRSACVVRPTDGSESYTYFILPIRT